MQRDFTFAEFVALMTDASRLGSPTPAVARRLNAYCVDLAAEARRMRGIGDSMTPSERERPDRMSASRRRRVAAGAGVGILDVSQLIRQFEMIRDVMRRTDTACWRGRVGAVLGLVTNDMSHRDPSYVLPLDAPGRRRLTWAAVIFAVGVVTFWLTQVFGPGRVP